MTISLIKEQFPHHIILVSEFINQEKIVKKDLFLSSAFLVIPTLVNIWETSDRAGSAALTA